MKHQFISLAAWVNTDPRRVRVVTLSVAVGLMIVAAVVPGAVTFAGWISGGGD
jgi:hypothetical protein